MFNWFHTLLSPVLFPLPPRRGCFVTITSIPLVTLFPRHWHRVLHFLNWIVTLSALSVAFMACVPALSILEKSVIQNDLSSEEIEASLRSFKEPTYVGHQLLLKDRDLISEMELETGNGFKNFAGLLELWRNGVFSSKEGTVFVGGTSQNTGPERKVNCITWDSFVDYDFDSDGAFLKDTEFEGRKGSPLTAELAGASPSLVHELEGRVCQIGSPDFMQELSLLGSCRVFKEDSKFSPIAKDLPMSVPKEIGYLYVVDNDSYEVTIEFSGHATHIHVLKISDFGASSFSKMKLDAYSPARSVALSCPTDEKMNSEASERSSSSLERTFQHVDVSAMKFGMKHDNSSESIMADASFGGSSHLSFNGIFDVYLAATGGYFGSCDNIDSFVGRSISKSYDNEEYSKVNKAVLFEKGEFGICRPEYQASLTAREPPEGLVYVLPYLDLQGLLALEQVSKSLRSAVRNDLSLWKILHIEDPLNEKITNDVLLRLTARAEGHLQCLSLLQCEKVTNYAIRQVWASNPLLIKLYLPGCSRVNIDGVVAMVKEFTDQKSSNGHFLKQLRVCGLYGITREHVEQLRSMLAGNLEEREPKPQYYHYGRDPVDWEDDRLIDVEVCPKCGNVRDVYDCTRDRCRQKQALKLQQCRGCTFCIARCEECGTCIDDIDYEETFCLGLLCSDCWLRIPTCVECNRPGYGKHVDHFIGSSDAILLCSYCDGSSVGEGAEISAYSI